MNNIIMMILISKMTNYLMYKKLIIYRMKIFEKFLRKQKKNIIKVLYSGIYQA